MKCMGMSEEWWVKCQAQRVAVTLDRVSPYSGSRVVGHKIGFQAQCSLHPYSMA